MMAAILNLAYLDSAILVFPLRLTHTCQEWFPPFAQKNSLIYSDSTWWWQPSWILPCCYLLSDSLKNTLTPLWHCHLEFCHLEFGHLGFNPLSFSSQTHSHLSSLVPIISRKKNFTHTSLSTNCTKKLHSFILTQCDDGSHLEFCHHGFSHFAQKNFTHSFWLNLVMAAILNSAMLETATAILDLDTLLSSLRFTQKHSHSTVTLTHTNSIWLKLIYSHLTWWWQPSWILPCWIQTLPSWIQTPC